MFKRAWKSVTRRKSKTIILTIILFVIANLVLANITIKNATEEAYTYARQSLGSEVLLTQDQEKIRSEMKSKMETEGPDSQAFKDVEISSIYLSDVESVIESDYVVDYSYGFEFNANAVDFTPIESDTEDTSGMMGKMREQFETGDIKIEAINAYDLIEDVLNENIELVEGEAFDESNGDDIIISYELAIANGLEIGDTIEIESLNRDDESIDKTLNIIGIYDEVDSENNSENSMIDSSNKMYININSGTSLLLEDEYNDGDYEVSNVRFYLDDPLNADAFVEEVNSLIPDLEDRDLLLDINNETYEQMVGPIEGVASSSSLIFVVVIIGAVSILSLLIVSQVKDRKYEIGVLLSLGEKKSKVAAQLLIELFFIATVAFTISLATSSIVSKNIGENLLSSQIEMSEEVSETTSGRGMGMQQVQKASTQVEAIDELNITASLEDYLALYLIGYLIIFGSLIIPTMQILRYEPKTILTGRGN